MIGYRIFRFVLASMPFLGAGVVYMAIRLYFDGI
jgi:hypothetical protein